MATPPVAIADALAKLWTRFLPEIQQRVAVLEAAALAAAAGTLSDPQRVEAHAAAHKLAGILGTFGLPEGTALARQAELLFGEETCPEPATTVTDIALRLRVLIDSRTL